MQTNPEQIEKYITVCQLLAQEELNLSDRTKLLEHLNPKRLLSVLDLGCGCGRHCLEFAKLGHLVTGIDQSDFSKKIQIL